MEITELLKAIRERESKGRWGIGMASAYLRQVEESGDPSTLVGVSPEQWSDAVKDAESRLVYCDPELAPVPRSTKAKDESAPGSIMEFDAIITTTRRDRDGDVLEAKGADPDLAMPLLWQHMPMMPIGKLLKITTQNSKRVAGRFAIADTAQGRDAAALVEFGALRISHGFLPSKYEELEDSEWGWHILEFEILETSLVSVPSNKDAIVTAFSRAKLAHPAIKSWAEQMYRERAVIVPAAVAPESPDTEQSSRAAGGDGIDDQRGAVAASPSAVEEKAGRVLSKANESRIRSAAEDLAAIIKMDDVPRAANSLAKQAAGSLSEVLDSLAQDDDEGKQITAGDVRSWIVTATPEQLVDIRLLLGVRDRIAARKRTAAMLQSVGL